MTTFNYKDAFQRNIGIYTDNEQEKLRTSRVAIIGAGGDGGLVAERLLRAGVGEIRICDPEDFALENLNRQYASNSLSLGQNKASVIADELRSINPDATIICLKEGINSSNVEDFVSGVDLIIDESEYSMPDLAIMVNRAGCKFNIPVLSGANVALGANIFAFSPSGLTVEKYYGMQGVDIAEARSMPVPIRAFCPVVPNYVDIGVFKNVSEGSISVPAVSQSVAAVAAYVVNEAVGYLTGKQDLVYMPYYISVDLYSRETKVRKANVFTFYLSLFNLMIVSAFRR